MNICLVSQEYPPETGGGGIGTQTFLKAHALAGLGHTVSVISCTYDGPARTYHDGKVIVHRIPHPACDTPFRERSVYWVGYSWAVAKKVYELLDEVKFDLIEFPEYGAEGFIYQLAGHDRLPVVVTIYGSLTMFAERTGWPPAESDFYRFGTFMEETVILRADLLLACSHNAAGFWAKRCGIPFEKIRVVHTAVDASAFPPTSVRKNGRPTVLFVGRIDEDKGTFTLTEAVLRLRPKYPDILFRIIGSGSKDKMKLLQEMIEANRAWQNFELLGRVPYDELSPYYAGCDVFASPAPQEHGLATVYLEALASGRPVVACNTGGAPEAVIDGKTGLLVSPGDVEASAQALDKLLANPEMRDRLGRNGRDMVVNYFSIDKHIRRVEQLYDELLAHWKESNGNGKSSN